MLQMICIGRGFNVLRHSHWRDLDVWKINEMVELVEMHYGSPSLGTGEDVLNGTWLPDLFKLKSLQLGIRESNFDFSLKGYLGHLCHEWLPYLCGNKILIVVDVIQRRKLVLNLGCHLQKRWRVGASPVYSLPSGLVLKPLVLIVVLIQHGILGEGLQLEE